MLAAGPFDADGEVAGLCDIWGGYIANNVCPTTCESDCSGWGAGEAFCGCLTLDNVEFSEAIGGPHIHDEATECIICDITGSYTRVGFPSGGAQCDLPYDEDANGIINIADLLGILSMFNVGCDAQVAGR
eukprot:SAG22_NODE_12498_length_440_cov_1.214076_1_plen_130_part_10